MNKVAETVAKGLFKAATKTATKLLTQEPEQYDQEPQEDQEQQPRYTPTTIEAAAKVHHQQLHKAYKHCVNYANICSPSKRVTNHIPHARRM